MTLIPSESSSLAVSAVCSAEVAATENPNPKADNPKNPALERCIKAWNRTYDLASINPKHESLDHFEENDVDELFARQQGANAFRSALPIIAGYENIRDFIACVTYGMLMDILPREECRELFEAAKIAMALLRAQARS
jgi:hypothetical protein